MRGITRLFILLTLLAGTPALAMPSAPSHEVPLGTGSVISSAAAEAYSVYTADLDGDGDLDVLSASRLDDKIAWYENSGSSSPTFTTHVISTDANGARSVHAADLDGDGDLDVLSASYDDDKIAWYENNGGSPPAFTPHTITTSANAAQFVYTADVDGDGDLDVLSASAYDDKVAWYENNGGSPLTFTTHVITTDADYAYVALAADLDGDGDVDVLSASSADDKIAWYENAGSSPPSFTTHVITTSDSAPGVASIYVADLDGDGDLDILSASYYDTIAWHENDGGSPPSFTTRTITTSADGARSVYAADVDGDGDLDVLSASSNDDKIAWHENNQSSPPIFSPHTITTEADSAKSVCAADLDGDGDVDVLSASRDDNKIAWYTNETIHRSAVYPAQAVITTAADSIRSVHAADVDGDSDVDILSASLDDDKIAWYENSGGSPPTFTTHAITTLADGAYSVYTADLDSDGDMDILSASADDDRIAWYENRGGSPPTFTTHTITASAAGAYSVYAADLNGDGAVDVLSASHSDHKIAWHENDGGSPPDFTDHVITTNAQSANSVYAADVDGDGDTDVLSASRNDDKIAWYENDGGSSPTFTEHIITTDAEGAFWVYAADVDGDGDLDVLSASAYDDKIAWYENDGGSSLTFTQHVITANAIEARSVCATDMDGDGDIDLLSASYGDGKIVWYENDDGSPSAFTSHTITAGGARSAYAADLDSDGDIDVLSASADDDRVAWFENDGGQFALSSTDTAPSTIAAAHQSDVLRIVVTHRGRAGDTDAELASLELLFEESPGHPLTTAQANNLIQNLHFYHDDGSGSFEPGTDTLITTVGTLSLLAGTQTITFFHRDPRVQMSYGTPITIFVVVELTEDADSQTPRQFRVTHLTESSSTAKDRDHDIPLSLEFTPNVSTKLITARASTWWIHLPLNLRDMVHYFEGPWEREENDAYVQANGSLRSGRDYYGYPDDAKDYFSLYLRTEGDITVNLSNHTGKGVQMSLFYRSPSDEVGWAWKEPYTIEHTGAPGWYYLYIYTESGHNTTERYTLQATFPQ